MCYDANAGMAQQASRPVFVGTPVQPFSTLSTVERLAQENDRLTAQVQALMQQAQRTAQEFQVAKQEAHTAKEFAKLMLNQHSNPIPW